LVRASTALGWLILAALLQAGCASVPPGPAGPAIELTDTPFNPQSENYCGPSALATALGASGVEVHPDTLAPLLYVPDRAGSLQVEVAAVPRRYDRLAVPIARSEAALVDQLRRGRPVLVLQNLAFESVPRWHYAVVVGYLPDAGRYVLRSGGARRDVVSRNRFLATWVRGGMWGVVVLAPEDPPGGLEPAAYLRAAASLESAGRYESALTAFDSALAAWPDEPMARLGRANNLYRVDRRDDAIAAYRSVLDAAPGDPVALHNLASVLVETGHTCEALAALPEPAAGESDLLASAREEAMRAARASGAKRCE
jgi:tetratricopeptide (TPR) repeat protein